MSTLVMDNKSNLIFKGPLQIECVVVSGAGAVANITLYDGVNDNQDAKMFLNSGSGFSFSPALLKPFSFKKGLYIKVNASTTYYTVIYSEQNDGNEK